MNAWILINAYECLNFLALVVRIMQWLSFYAVFEEAFRESIKKTPIYTETIRAECIEGVEILAPARAAFLPEKLPLSNGKDLLATLLLSLAETATWSGCRSFTLHSNEHAEWESFSFRQEQSWLTFIDWLLTRSCALDRIGGRRSGVIFQRIPWEQKFRVQKV